MIEALKIMEDAHQREEKYASDKLLHLRAALLEIREISGKALELPGVNLEMKQIHAITLRMLQAHSKEKTKE